MNRADTRLFYSADVFSDARCFAEEILDCARRSLAFIASGAAGLSRIFSVGRNMSRRELNDTDAFSSDAF
ncbi:hypothetical protein [Gimesia maris]|uniref:Four helix bundle protein n=1 Tax=Gimesia maris TaxID=122 RepID=A0ABX5YNL3_9PLAN|nr:hypothetical protein [Gimesia maris]EDL62391.1 hypothetical protein PM8797T_28724 [Gimesia maris DSM 8797]QEG17222.1 hypothetical protein GmarT_31000 [Gimesia maris]QGQ29679.1 hypothetical protein F1729_14015 [Gimesia maris]